jgi:Zn-dependent oligopeptidase
MNYFLDIDKLHDKFLPFDIFKPEHFTEGLDKIQIEVEQKIQDLVDSKGAITFENTIGFLELTLQPISQMANIFFSLHSAEGTEELRSVAKTFIPDLTNFYSHLLLNEKLFKRIDYLYNQNNLNLNPEEHKVLEEYFLEFKRNGALLTEENKNIIKEIDQELSKLTLAFGENVLNYTKENFLTVENKSDLLGLPENFIQKAQEEAKKRNLTEKFVITLDPPTLIVFLKYCDSSELRKKLFTINILKACSGLYNNNENVISILKLRNQRARLLNYQSHAHFVLERRMLKTPEKVMTFLNDLLTYSQSAASRDLDELKSFAQTDIQRWDYAYYAEKLKEEKFSINDEILRPYFPLHQVLNGVFNLAGKLYNLEFKKLEKAPTYHEEVSVYEVTDVKQNKFIGLFYTDFHPRPNKKSGAWMTSLRDQSRLNNFESRPHVMIVCNFTRPHQSAPSLLTFDEVRTLFHEFGHALHSLLSECTFPKLSGTNVFWDFVELPSQILENWTLEPECLKEFAYHYETKEKLPQHLIEKIRECDQYQEGFNTLRQLNFAFLDMGLHQSNPETIKSLEKWEKENLSQTNLFPHFEGSSMSTSFSHLFNGGYSAGYYSYKWAEVLEADAFEEFKVNGIFNSSVAEKFRTFILSKGGTVDPLEAYIKFKGAGPSVNPLLKRSGLIRNKRS